MSKLAEAIRRTLRSEAAPMGFGAARAAPKATMLVGVIGGAAGDADVVVLEARGKVPSPSDVERARGEGVAVVGLRANDVERSALEELRKGGLDFLLFDPDSTPAAALLDDQLGYVMAVSGEADEGYLRSLSPLNLDAFYLEDLPSPLTVARQLELTRIGVFGGRPIVARVKADADKTELECLRAAGVVVLLLEDASGVARLKETVMSLPPRRVRKDERPSIAVALPRTQPEHDHEEEEDDD
jgi:hypothetical protein